MMSILVELETRRKILTTSSIYLNFNKDIGVDRAENALRRGSTGGDCLPIVSRGVVQFDDTWLALIREVC